MGNNTIEDEVRDGKRPILAEDIQHEATHQASLIEQILDLATQVDIPFCYDWLTSYDKELFLIRKIQCLPSTNKNED